MLFFAHLGLGAVCGVAVTEADKRMEPAEPIQLDYRLVLLGAILPDLLDKPLGELIFPGTFHSGKIFGHTLLVSACLVVAGSALYRSRKRTGVLSLGIGTTSHLLGDAMWNTAATFLWPLLGWFRPEEAAGTWFQRMLYYLSSPYIFFTEMAGILILLYLAYRAGLTEPGKLASFGRVGKLPVAPG